MYEQAELERTGAPVTDSDIDRVCAKILEGRPFELDRNVFIGSAAGPEHVALAQLLPNGAWRTDVGQIRKFRIEDYARQGLVRLLDDIHKPEPLPA